MVTNHIFPFDKIFCIECSLKLVSSEVLKRVFFPKIDVALKEFHSLPDISECVIIQKCNCVEIYAVGNSTNTETIVARVFQKWEQLLNFSDDIDLHNMEIHYGREAIYHLYRVASSLESLIIGDNQVLSQVSNSLHIAAQQGTAKDVLSHIFNEAISASKIIYSQTKLHGNGVSIGRVAVAALTEQLAEPAEAVTVVGSGHIADIVIDALKKKWKSTKIFIITNRPDYIKVKYPLPNIEGHNRTELASYASISDALILCTDTYIPMITKSDLKKFSTNGRLRVLIDLGMPPNAEQIDNEDLVTFKLTDIVNFGRIRYSKRIEESKTAENIINNAFDNFDNTLLSYERNKILRSLGPKIHRAVEKPNIESSVMGILINIIDNLTLEELSAIDAAIEKNTQ